MANVLDLVTWLLHWRYVALAIVILLGNVGLPVPEEMVLTLAGYLVREGHLALGSTLAVGIASVVAGDNLGYWLGRFGGRPIVRRGACWAGVTPVRLERIQGLVSRCGALVVVAARFVAGFRMLAGPRGRLRDAAADIHGRESGGRRALCSYALALGCVVGRGLHAVGPPTRAWVR
jgi:membrane protein DedA with SNARE-associated domain